MRRWHPWRTVVPLFPDSASVGTFILDCQHTELWSSPRYLATALWMDWDEHSLTKSEGICISQPRLRSGANLLISRWSRRTAEGQIVTVRLLGFTAELKIWKWADYFLAWYKWVTEKRKPQTRHIESPGSLSVGTFFMDNWHGRWPSPPAGGAIPGPMILMILGCIINRLGKL